MNVEKLDRVAIRVSNVEESVKALSSILNTKFDVVYDVTLHGKKTKIAMSPLGIELIEGEPLGLRSVVIKVPDLETAKIEMKNKGFSPKEEELKIGDLRELLYDFDDILGISGRFVLAAYDAPHPAMQALKSPTNLKVQQ